MIKVLKSIAIISMLVAAPLFLTAQNPPHPNGGNGPGGGNTPVGGGAPIDGGISILVALGAAYGARRFYQQNK